MLKFENEYKDLNSVISGMFEEPLERSICTVKNKLRKTCSICRDCLKILEDSEGSLLIVLKVFSVPSFA